MPISIVRDVLIADAPATATAARAAAATTIRLRTRWTGLGLERRDRPTQAFLELDLWLPAEDLARAGDVRLPHLRVVLRQRLEDDLALRVGEPDDELRELEQRELGWVADVDRMMLVAAGEQVEPADQVVDVAEAPRLLAFAEDGQRLPRDRLAQERRDRPAVVRPHSGPVGVEDPRDAVVDALLPVVGHGQRLGVPLRLVVDAARADRVDVAPV